MKRSLPSLSVSRKSLKQEMDEKRNLLKKRMPFQTLGASGFPWLFAFFSVWLTRSGANGTTRALHSNLGICTASATVFASASRQRGATNLKTRAPPRLATSSGAGVLQQRTLSCNPGLALTPSTPSLIMNRAEWPALIPFRVGVKGKRRIDPLHRQMMRVLESLNRFLCTSGC